MTDSPPAISPDLPEVRALAQLGGIAPSRLAAGFSDPEHFFEHITPEQLARIQEGCARVAALSLNLTARVRQVYLKYARGALNGSR